MADEALLLAKNCGRNQFKVFERLGSLEESSHSTCQLSSVRADALMLTPPICINRGTPIGQVANQLVRLRVDSLAVVDDSNQLVGVIAEKDLFQQTPQENSWNASVDTIMQTNYVCFDGETPLSTIWDFFRRIAFSRVVIVNNGQPAGTITRAMLLRWAVSYYFGDSTGENNPDESAFVDRIEHLTTSIIDEMHRLQEYVSQESPVKSLPALVMGSTRLQEQSDQLLSQTRFAASQGARTGGDPESGISY